MILRILSIALAILCFSIAWNARTDNRLFRNYGKTAQVLPIHSFTEVTTVWRDKKTGAESSRSKHNEVEAYFMTEDGVRTKISQRIPKNIVEQLIDNQPVEIQYVSTQPNKVRFDREPASTGTAVFVGVVFLLLAFMPRRRI